MIKSIPATIKFVIFILPLIGGCAATRRVSMNTIRPADVSLSQDIRTIILVDRTRLENGVMNIIEGALTGELPMEDRDAVQDGLRTIQEMFHTTNRFNGIIDAFRYTGNSMTTAFPRPLPWPKVASICRPHNAQAILAIEIFDTDFIITESSRMVKKEIKEGENTVEKEVEEYYAEGVMDLKMGIRLYDNINRQIADEKVYTKTRSWKTKADSKAQAVAKLIRKVDATRAITRRLCRMYTYRIAPQPIVLSRNFYCNNSKCLAVEKGARYAEVDNWEKAIQVWEDGIKQAEPKVAGLLAYNIAVGYEVLGDYETALKWAQDSYTEFGNKKAMGYVAELQTRITSEKRVDEQMGTQE